MSDAAPYSSMRQALRRAFQQVGKEDAVIRTIDPSTVDPSMLFDHADRARSEMTSLDWAAEDGLTHRIIRDCLGGVTDPRYLALKAKYCEYMEHRQEAMLSLASRCRSSTLRPLQRKAVVAMWAMGLKVSYTMIDEGNGNAKSTIQKRIDGVRKQLRQWHDAGWEHAQRTLILTGKLSAETVLTEKA